MKNGSLEEEENNGVEKEEKRKWGESRKKQRVGRRKCERSEVYIGRKWGRVEGKNLNFLQKVEGMCGA